MSVKRQLNVLSGMRLEVADVRAIESSICNDFDLLTGQIMTGKDPVIISGFTLSTSDTLDNPADELVLNMAGGCLINYNASESGSMFALPDDAPAQTLNATNTNVTGSFTALSTNYIGLDLKRVTDSDTNDVTKFWSEGQQQEITKIVPKATKLTYKIIINSYPFSIFSNIVPIAKVVTDASNNVVSITDARPLIFRLGRGGDNPNGQSSWDWDSRIENPITYESGATDDPFTGGDKSIVSLKSWMDAVMTTVWESKSGQYWYSPTARDNVKLLYGQPLVSTNSDNFHFTIPSNVSGINITFTNANPDTITRASGSFISDGWVPGVDVTVTGSVSNNGTYRVASVSATVLTLDPAETLTNEGPSGGITLAAPAFLTWAGLKVAFENSKASDGTDVYSNDIKGVVASTTGASDGSETYGDSILDGQCLYVDIQRDEQDAELTPAVADLADLGSPTLPGSRFILAWRIGTSVYVRDRAYEAGRDFQPATTTTLGIVKLNSDPDDPLEPEVVVTGDSGKAIGTGLSRYGLTNGALTIGKNIQDTSIVMDVGAAGPITIGTTTQNALTVGRAGAASALNGSTITLTGATSVALASATVNVGNATSTTTVGDKLVVTNASAATNGIDVTAGDVRISNTAKFKHASNVTRYAHISPTEMATNYSGTNAEIVLGTTRPYIRNTNNAADYYTAGRAKVPAGATITAIEAIVKNDGGVVVGNVELLAYVRNYSGGDYADSNDTEIATGPATVAVPGAGVTAALNFTISTGSTEANGDSFVYIRLHVPAGNAGSIQVLGVRITYTFTNFVPEA